MPNNLQKPVKVPPSDNASKRVVIVQRPDGLYAICPEIWLTDCDCWIPFQSEPNSRLLGIFGSIDLAVAEAFAVYPWLKSTIST